MPRNPLTTILLDAPATPVSRMPLARLGEYEDPRYGKFPITAGDVADWQKNLEKLPGGRALIDQDHSANRKSPHRDTEASGWITGIELEGKQVWADVEWTPRGESAIKEKRYLFASPTYGPYTNDAGETFPNTLSGAALTNKPFLTSQPQVMLASADTVAQAVADGDDDLKALAAEHASVVALDGPIDTPERAYEHAVQLQARTQSEGDVRNTSPGGDGSIGYSLDTPPRVLMADHTAVNHLVLSLSAATGRGFSETLDELTKLGGAATLRGAVGRMQDGQRALDAVETSLRDLAARSTESLRMLDVETQIAADAPAGEVPLAQDFDRSAYKHDPAAQERDWYRARQLSGFYARSPREVFDEANMNYLDAGCSLVKSLERPARVETARRALTAAQHPGGAPVVRTLDSPAPVTKFVDLSGEQMLVALEVWGQEDHRITLDQAAARVSGTAVGDDVVPTVGIDYGIPGLGDHHEIDKAIRDHVASHKCDYACGLASVTGVGLPEGLAVQ